MKRLHWRRAVVLALIVGAVAAAAATASSGSNHRASGTPSKYVFGGSFTLTGPAAFLGLFEEAAVRLAVQQFMKGDCIIQSVPPEPCKGGGLLVGGKKYPIVWKAYDDQSDARKAIDNVTRLIESDHARTVWGPRMNDAVVSAASILEPRKIIEICSICSSPAMTIGRKYGFDITDTGVIEKHAIGEFINEPDAFLKAHGVDPSFLTGRKQTAFIGRDELYTVHGSYGWEDAMKRGSRHFAFNRSKDTILYPFGTTDFSSYVAKLAAIHPQIVLMDAYVVPFLKPMMNSLSYSCPVCWWLSGRRNNCSLGYRRPFRCSDFIAAAILSLSVIVPAFSIAKNNHMAASYVPWSNGLEAPTFVFANFAL